MFLAAVGYSPSVPRSIYLEKVESFVYPQSWFSDVWGLSFGGGIVPGLRPRAGDTVYLYGERCHLNIDTADTPRVVIRHNGYKATGVTRGVVSVFDGRTLNLGNGTDSVINDCVTPTDGIYFQNETTTSTTGTGKVIFAGKSDFSNGPVVCNYLRFKNSAEQDYISPEGTPPMTVLFDAGVEIDFSLKDGSVIGNVSDPHNRTDFILNAGSRAYGGRAQLSADATITGSGQWDQRVDMVGIADLDITGFTGLFQPTVLQLAGTANTLTFNAGQDLSLIGQVSLQGSTTWAPEHDLTTKLIAFSAGGVLDLATHSVTLSISATGIVLSGAKTTGSGAAILNSISNPVLFTGSGSQQLRGTVNIANEKYWGHLLQTGTGTMYMSDSNPSFESLEVKGTLRVSAATIPEFGGNLVMLSGAVFFSSGSWSGMGFKCNNLTLNGQNLSNATLTIRGTGTAAGGTFTNVDCSGGNALTVTGGTNGGGNTNIIFI